MTLDVLIYRVHRLRRLVVVALLPTVAALAMVWPGLGDLERAVLLGVALLPLLHTVAYPAAWIETISMSLSATGTIALATVLDPGFPLDRRLVLMLVFLALVIAGFFTLAALLNNADHRGPRIVPVFRHLATSTLPIDRLKPRVTIHPGRSDAVVICGPEDPDGVFQVSYKVDYVNAVPIDPDPLSTCRILVSDQTCHQVSCRISGNDSEAVSRIDFRPRDSGCEIRFFETGLAIPMGMALGMYLQDFVADTVRRQIDLAEGRPPVANRAFPIRYLMTDLITMIARGAGRAGRTR